MSDGLIEQEADIRKLLDHLGEHPHVGRLGLAFPAEKLPATITWVDRIIVNDHANRGRSIRNMRAYEGGGAF